jgi:SAM-dependent methyltransferase
MLNREMGDKFPSAEVIGIDITPSQPKWVPLNVTFQISDAHHDWTFEQESFDFIHIRNLHGSITDWKKLYREAFKALEPGGWIEHIETNLQMGSDNPHIKIRENQ